MIDLTLTKQHLEKIAQLAEDYRNLLTAARDFRTRVRAKAIAPYGANLTSCRLCNREWRNFQTEVHRNDCPASPDDALAEMVGGE